MPVAVSDQAAEANSFEGRLALNPSGKVYIFWLDERDRTDWRQPGNAIYFTTIDGHGSVNPANRKLSGTICECCRIAASFDNDGLPVLLARLIYPGDIRDHGLIRLEALAQLIEIRQSADIESGVDRSREFGFTGAVMGERQQADHDPASLFLAFFGQQRREGAGIGAAREQLIAIDQVEQRHRLLAQRMDDVMVVDDVAMFAAALRRPAPP